MLCVNKTKEAITILPAGKLKEEVTIVTAYFNLGSFQKGFWPWKHFSSETYESWMQVFQDLNSPVLAFFENEQDIRMFERIRSMQPCNMTKTYLINRTLLWSFSLQERIHELYSLPGYPRFSPNTVIPEYSCAMHAKYDLIKMAARENPFHTKYIAWMDIGYFRDIPYDSGSFSFHIPPGFDESKVAYSEVWPFRPELTTARQIVSGNYVWVGGGLFIARVDVIREWVRKYVMVTERMLDDGWVSTDQQVLYMMQALESRDPPLGSRVGMQVFKWESHEPWFNLGYLCTAQGPEQSRKLRSM